MIIKLHFQIRRISNLRNLLILLVVIIALNAILISAPFSPMTTLQAYSGGAGILDTEFNYTPDKAYQILTAYGETGREYYVSVFSVIDLFVPLIVALFLSVALTVILQAAFPLGNFIQKLNLLPFAAMIADYLENIGIFSMIVFFPMRLDVLSWLTSFFTIAKFLLTFGCFILILIGVLKLIWNRFLLQFIQT